MRPKPRLLIIAALMLAGALAAHALPAIGVYSPRQGQSFINGSWMTIAWEDSSITNPYRYDLFLSGVAGTWTQIGSQSLVDCTMYAWRVSAPAGSYRIKVKAIPTNRRNPSWEGISQTFSVSLLRRLADGTEVQEGMEGSAPEAILITDPAGDESVREGEIKDKQRDPLDVIVPVPGVRVINPNGGEVYSWGQSARIEWDCTVPATSFSVMLSVDGGVKWTSLAKNLSEKARSVDWKVSQGHAQDCLVKVVVAGEKGKTMEDVSDESFLIIEARRDIPNEPGAESSGDREQRGVKAPEAVPAPNEDMPIMHPPDRGDKPRDETVIAEPKQDQPIMHEPDRGAPIDPKDVKDVKPPQESLRPKPDRNAKITREPDKKALTDDKSVIADPSKDQPIMHEPDRGAKPRDETVIAEPSKDQPIMHEPDRGAPIDPKDVKDVKPPQESLRPKPDRNAKITREPDKKALSDDKSVIAEPSKDQPIMHEPDRGAPVDPKDVKDVKPPQESLRPKPDRNAKITREPDKKALSDDKSVMAEPKQDQPIMHEPDRGAKPRDETVIAEPSKDQPIMHEPDRGAEPRDEQVAPGEIPAPNAPEVIPDPQHDRPIDAPQPVLRLSRPNGGESIARNAKYMIEWACPLPVKQFDLLLSTDGGKSYITLATGINAHTYSYEWTVKTKAAAQCKIKLLAVTMSGTVMEDLSDAFFSISNPPRSGKARPTE